MAIGKGKAKEGQLDEKQEDAAKQAAAVLIQRMWRGGRHNTAKEEHLDAKLRWDDAATHAKLAIDRKEALDGKNNPRQRWSRAVFFISQLMDKNDMLEGEGIQMEAEQKHLETQHWLELVDGKHRYGSNLKYYHKRWQEDDTKDNFFKWLDYGGGKDLSLDECPRETLEKERILYLSVEQRLNYLVKISDDGKLLWAKNNQPVDTTAGDWKDTEDGGGIVPDYMPVKPPSATRASEPFTDTASQTSKDQENAASHYAGLPQGRNTWAAFFRRNFTPKGFMERLLRKTVRKNTWIYVSDKNFNIFVGIKETGAFQHSSFVSGGIVTSAGLISVKQGVIHTLSPLSGHYRTSTGHFHRFIEVLTERGVDMHKVHISKAEAALWGIEHLKKFEKAQSHAVSEGKKKVKNAPHQIKALVTKKPSGDSGWKKEVLMGRQSSDHKGETEEKAEGTRSEPQPENGEADQKVEAKESEKTDLEKAAPKERDEPSPPTTNVSPRPEG